jgi:ribonuclease HII
MEVIIGLDEAGYGCWAGSLWVAAVAWPKIGEFPELHLIKDSKKTSLAGRATLANQIKDQCLWWYLWEIKVEEFVLHSPYYLKYQKPADTIRGLPWSFPIRTIYDGNRSLEGTGFPSESLVRGDALVPQISAASILAKNAKDVEMAALNTKYPEYGFAQHQGYGTLKHKEAIRKYGFTEVHRTTFDIKL